MAPPCLTAIRDLPERALRGTVAALERALARGGDDELRWMLAWYHGRAPALFEVYGGGAAVARFVRGVPPDAWRAARVRPAELADRGQLGAYWAALLGGRALPGGARPDA